MLYVELSSTLIELNKRTNTSLFLLLMLQLDISNQGVYIMSKVPVYTQRAQQNYRDSTLSVQLTINPRTEPELYDVLKDMPKRATYIKELIKKDKGIK